MQQPYYQPPMPQPRKRRNGLLIVLGVLLVAVLLVCVVLSMAVSSATGGSTRASATPAPAIRTAPAKTLLKVSGTGDTTTKAFTASGAWTVQWSCTPSPDVSAAPLYINVINSDGSPSDIGDISAMCKKGATSGSSDMPQGGTYRLKVIAGIDWTLKVTG